MKIFMKKGVSVLLVLVMLIALSVPAFAATPKNVKEYKNVVAFGDSIVCADELPGCKNFDISKYSYPCVLSEMLGLEGTYHSLACQGTSAIDALFILGAAPDNYMELGSVDYIRKLLGDKFIQNTLVKTAEGKNPTVGDPRQVVKCTSSKPTFRGLNVGWSRLNI